MTNDQICIRIRKRLQSASGPMELMVNESIDAGKFVALYGPSGAGKTTLLRMVAGLTTPDEGSITIDSNTWIDTSRKFELPTRHREVGFVFQDYALFPHMNVWRNLTFALPKKANRAIVDELLEVMELGGLADRMPGALSGGQRQRVALARALVRQPRILLLDEPLSALDVELRAKLQDTLRMLHQRFHLTTIMVSHDLPEIFKLADYIIRLDHGMVIQSGTPEAVFSTQAMSGKFRFTGEVLSVTQSDVVSLVSVRIGNDIAKVVVTKDESASLKIGDRVIVSSKAFNPVVVKI